MPMLEKNEIQNMSPSGDGKRFLFANWEGGGNTPPVVAIVKRLVQRGHVAHVVSDPCNRDEFEAAGASFSSWRRAPVRLDRTADSDPLRDWEVASPPALLARIRDRVLVGPALAYAEDLLEEFASHPADVVVSNDMLFGSMMAAEKLRIPCAALAPNISISDLPGVPPFGPGLMPATGALGHIRDAAIRGVTKFIMGRTAAQYNHARASLGLAPLRHPLDQLTRVDRLVLLTSQAFDFPSTNLPAHVSYAGPELTDPAWTANWEAPRFEGNQLPLVLVGFSTTFQNQLSILRRVSQALGEMPVTAILTVGPAINLADLKVPGNVHVCRAAPHSVLLKQASVTVTHAGHGTVIRSLAAGVPLLCIPMGRDQNDNAARVAWHGAGLRLGMDAGIEAIRGAITRLLDEPGFREKARGLGEVIARDAAQSRAIPILEELAARKPRP